MEDIMTAQSATAMQTTKGSLPVKKVQEICWSNSTAFMTRSLEERSSCLKAMVAG
jgi:hypothetical protein